MLSPLSRSNNPRGIVKALANYEERMRLVANEDAKFSLPVVLEVLGEISSILKKPGIVGDSKFDATRECVEYGMFILDETITKQNASRFRKLTLFMTLSKVQIEGELLKFVEYIDKININAQSKSLWEEAAVWLDGIYKRVESQMPRDKQGQVLTRMNGVPSTIDNEDAAFYKWVGLTKYDVVCYYHKIADTINHKCKNFQFESCPAHAFKIRPSRSFVEEIAESTRPAFRR